MGHIPCNKRITYPSRDYTNCLFTIAQNIQHLGLYCFGKAHAGLTRCAKFLLEIKYTNHYTEKILFFIVVVKS